MGRRLLLSIAHAVWISKVILGRLLPSKRRVLILIVSLRRVRLVILVSTAHSSTIPASLSIKSTFAPISRRLPLLLILYQFVYTSFCLFTVRLFPANLHSAFSVIRPRISILLRHKYTSVRPVGNRLQRFALFTNDQAHVPIFDRNS